MKPARLEIYDLTGRLALSGATDIVLNQAGSLETGIYLYRYTIATHAGKGRIVVVR